MGRAKHSICFTVAYFAVISHMRVNEIGKNYSVAQKTSMDQLLLCILLQPVSEPNQILHANEHNET